MTVDCVCDGFDKLADDIFFTWNLNYWYYLIHVKNLASVKIIHNKLQLFFLVILVGCLIFENCFQSHMDKTNYLKYILVETKDEGSISCWSVLSNLLDAQY